MLQSVISLIIVLFFLGGLSDDDSVKRNYSETLYELLKNHNMPSGFFYELVQHLQSDADRFQNIFTPLLYIIRSESQRGMIRRVDVSLNVFHLIYEFSIGSIADSTNLGPLQLLADLCEYRNGTARPFCTLLTRLSNWLVMDPLTEAVGREFAKFTYMGPFLCTSSLFAEDDPRIASKLGAFGSSASPSESARPVVQSLQQEAELTRNLLHKVFYALLSNAASREPTLNWIALALKRNEKRSMINVESRLVAGDGFFLNLAAVMHQLSLKIKLDKVDVYYPFHPQGRLTSSTSGETKIRVDSQENQDWLKQLQQSGHVWQVRISLYFRTHGHTFIVILLIRSVNSPPNVGS